MSTQSDKLIVSQFLAKHRQKELRRRKEIPLTIGSGSLSTGSIFDCNRKSFERALKDLDQRLYVGWNPYKNEGRGIWEVWYRPSKKTAQIEAECKDYVISVLEYRPSDMEHWVKDLDFLSYDFIRQLREMDMWENKQFAEQLDQKLVDHEKKLDKDLNDSIKYTVKHNKKEFGQLKELAEHGYNPLWFFSDKKQGSGNI